MTRINSPVSSPTIITAASREWFSRPDDQRFLSLAELHASVMQRKRESWTATPNVSDVRIMPTGEKSLAIELFDPTAAERRQLSPTNFAFGQMAQYASAPAAYLRRLPAELAAICLQWGLEKMPMREDGLFLAQTNGHHTLRSITSTSYGRIWDHQVVEAVQRSNQDNRWQIPAASYQAQQPKRATTLYASDRDVFIFLVDPKNEIEVNGDVLFRGFIVTNSEVGAGSFSLTTFLYRTVCDNRIIWGATNIKELRIRHTGGAPERFEYEGGRYLARYAEESTDFLVQAIGRAQHKELPEAKKEGGMVEWLQNRGFSKPTAVASVEAAQAEEGKARTLWDIINGITAHARSLSHTDARVELETKAGKLMDLVAA